MIIPHPFWSAYHQQSSQQTVYPLQDQVPKLGQQNSEKESDFELFTLICRQN